MKPPKKYMFIGSYAYMPQQTIDRAAIAKLIFLATTLTNHENIAEKNTALFADIDGNWAEKHIEYCVDKGIMATDNANVTIDNATHAGQQGKTSILCLKTQM